MNPGKEPYAIGLRRLNCQWCATATVHDTHKFWLHCSRCTRCYACGKAQRCGHCLKYEEACEKETAGVVPPDWLDRALEWIRHS